MVEGLKRLIANDYKLTESERTRDNLKEAMEDSNNIAQFLESDGYIRLEEGTAARSVHLYAAYKRWCKDSGLLHFRRSVLPKKTTLNIPIKRKESNGKKRRNPPYSSKKQ